MALIRHRTAAMMNESHQQPIHRESLEFSPILLHTHFRRPQFVNQVFIRDLFDGGVCISVWHTAAIPNTTKRARMPGTHIYLMATDFLHNYTASAITKCRKRFVCAL